MAALSADAPGRAPLIEALLNVLLTLFPRFAKCRIPDGQRPALEERNQNQAKGSTAPCPNSRRKT
jgi:hypothetical protein